MKKLVLIITVFFISAVVIAEDLTIVTMNSWPGISSSGFLSCREYETEEVRLFRHEVLSAGLEKFDADVIVLNGINPAQEFAEETAERLGMTANVWVSRSGFRIGPVSLPLNLKAGDAILAREELGSEFAGRKVLNGGISNRTFTLFSRNGSQIISSKINLGGMDVYIFSAEWTESVFSDRRSLELLLDNYLGDVIEPEVYSELIENAVAGAKLRLAQAEETLAFINSTAGEAPAVLCGSLNALPGSDEMMILESAGFVDVYQTSGRGPGYTWDPDVNTNIGKLNGGRPQAACRTDYILIRGMALDAASAEIVFDEPVYGVYPSTRFGVRAVLRLSENPSGQ